MALAAAREAGELAASLQGLVQSRTKVVGSPFTDADLAADVVLRAHLKTHFPEDGILSEEGAKDPARHAARRVWIIDPIDGTSEYVRGDGQWAVQIALAVDGELRLGVVVIPREGVALVGVPGTGGSIITPEGARPLAATPCARATLIASSSKRNAAALSQVRAALPEFTLKSATSVGVKVWRMLAGQADLYVHARRIHEWDVAAPAAVLDAAGGHATDLGGLAFRFNQPEPTMPGLLFSTRADHAELARRLRASGVVVA